jgi:hypothetical protein
MKGITILLLCCMILIFQNTFSQEKKCCDIPSCKLRSEELAARITGLAKFIKSKGEDKAANAQVLDSLKAANPTLFNDFIHTMKDIVTYINDHEQDLCFADRLPEDVSDNIFNWIIYFNDKEHPTKFPSTEFCSGLKKRFEVSQGAMNALRNDMAYLGSIRGYIVYTFGKKDQCGNKLRLMTGPAFFLQNKVVYSTLSSRISFRLKDIAPVPFSLGNFNLFGEYTTSFRHFEYAAIGAEVELGPLGFNLAINQNLKSHHQGFLVSIVFGNKKL